MGVLKLGSETVTPAITGGADLSSTGYIEPNTTYSIQAGESIQDVFDSFANKWCPGTVIIQLGAGTWNLGTPLTLNNKNDIQQISIVGASKSTTIINIPTVTYASEITLQISDQHLVLLEDLTLSTQNTNNSIVLEAQNSRVELNNVSLQNGNLCAINNQGNSVVKLQDNCDITNTSTSSFGILSSNGSKFICNANKTLTMSNCSNGLYAEMGAMNCIFYLHLDTTNVTTQFNPSLNAHTSSGWNLGTTS